jgi:hypothetical protein
MADLKPKPGSPVKGVPPPAVAPPQDPEKKETLPETKDGGAEVKESAKEKLAKRKEAAKQNAMVSAYERLDLFDTTKADKWETVSKIKPKATAGDDGGYRLVGKAIGATQREPAWNEQQMKAINQATNTILPIYQVTNSRSTKADPDQVFVEIDEQGNSGPSEKAYLSAIDTKDYVIGVGRKNYDTTGQNPKYYMDAVMAGSGGNWQINQWTSDLCVLDGIDPSVLLKQTRPGNKNNRKIGIHFARIGLHKAAFGPLFNTLNQEYPGFLEKVSVTDGFYWVNASWGVTTSPGQFISVNNKTKAVEQTTILQDVMKKLGGKSAVGIATVAISVTFEVINDRSTRPPPNEQKAGISVKLHNFCMIDEVEYHGPQQQMASSMRVPQRILDKAKGLTSGVGVGGSGMGSVFAVDRGADRPQQSAPSTKSEDSTVFMS